MGLFIPRENLVKLDEYKYQSEDRSIITKYVLKPFWTWFVQIFPLWMAPNVVTLLGFVFVVLSLAIVLYYDPMLLSNNPRWAYFFYGFGLFMYQTFDACDGTHARRTGQSGPLGELFDHCVDALNTTLSIIVSASVFGFGFSWLLIIAQFATLTNFYLSTWEEYHTHKLFLSEFSGPVEGILGVMGLYFLTGTYGPELWQISIYQVDLRAFGFSDEAYKITLLRIFVVLSAIGLLFNIESARANVANHYKDTMKSVHAYKGLIPFYLYYGTVAFWLWFNPYVIETLCIPFILTIGFTVAFVVGRIIIAHLTKQDFPYNNAPYYIPLLEFVFYVISTKAGYDPTLTSIALVWTGLGLSLGIYAMFIAIIIYDITTYLDIYVLGIKHPKKEKQ